VRRKNRRRRPKGASVRQLIERRRHIRAIFMGIIFTGALVVLLHQIWYYQTVWGDEYTRLVAQQAARHQIGLIARDIAPSRGIITDRNMQPIASSRQVFTVFLDPVALHHRHRRDSRLDEGIDIRDDVLSTITRTFGIPRFQLDELFVEDFLDGSVLTTSRHFILERNVPPEIAMPLVEAFPEIHANEESLRWHQDPFFAPQVLGFQWGDSIWGLEAQYNSDLSGEAGRTVWIQGGEVEEVMVRDGYTLVTTFDSDIQRLAQRSVDQAFGEIESLHAGIIVMNPHTGEILAMAQAPSFSLAEPMNPRYFTCEDTVEAWDGLSGQERTDAVMRMWRNFHTTRSNEPGSTFKPFVIAAAIEEGIINMHTPFYCEGVRLIYDRYVSCWNRWGHGSINTREALYMSCNLAMVDINRMLGVDTFYRYRNYFGFGNHTGIDLPGEMDVSHPSVMYPRWRLGLVEMATSSMGQGFNTTSLQMINGHAALINGGNIMEPFFVSQIVDSSGNVVYDRQPTVVRRAISQYTSDLLRREMALSISADRGTGRALAIPGHAIGGKTGTGQQGVRANQIYTVTLVAYTPVENPEFLVLMTIDHIHGPDGGTTAGALVAPRLRVFLEELIRMRNLQPGGNMDMNDWQLAMGAPTMPDYSGQRLADVVRDFNRADTSGFQVVGAGTIVSHHFPEAGAPMPENVPVIFHMQPDTRIDGLMTFMPDVEGLSVEQAQFLLEEMGLPHVTFASARPQTGDGNFHPHTANAVPRDEYENGLAPTAPVTYVYSQFPRAGTELEMGTQVIIRIR